MTETLQNETIPTPDVASPPVRNAERDAAICRYYLEGHNQAACASKFQLGRQRVIQILKAAGIWKPYEKTTRTKFLGVSIKEETKAALEQKADEAGVSVSRFASDALDAIVGTNDGVGASADEVKS